MIVFSNPPKNQHDRSANKVLHDFMNIPSEETSLIVSDYDKENFEVNVKKIIPK